MVHIYAANYHPDRCSQLIREYRRQLPESCTERANTFKFEIDRHRCMLGKILLIKGIEMLGYSNLTLEQLYVDEFYKPRFRHAPWFNISHSGDYVVCVISREFNVGIDIEEMIRIDYTGYSGCFTFGERAYINGSEEPLKAFYKCWTRKEAVIKADGRGMNIPLLSFDVLHDNINIDGNRWHIHEAMIAEGYCAHVAVNAHIKGNCTIQQII